jgi:hypothetical protein
MKTHTPFLTLGAAAVAMLPVVGTIAPASAALSASTVTIKAEGVDLSGTVQSHRQACITDRKVIVFKQIGTRGGGDDVKFASDLASSDGSWNTGTTGTSGRFYARIRATSTCTRDTSPTIRASR